MKKWIKRITMTLVGLALAAGLVMLFLPQPIATDIGTVTRGPLQVAIEEDGKTRIRQRYVVSSPLTGRLLRVELKAGDSVTAGETVLGTLEPTDPSLLDPRTLTQTKLRVKAAEAALKQSRTTLDRAKAALDFASSELTRLKQLLGRNAKSPQEVEEAHMREKIRQEEFKAAKFTEEIARYELDLANAALLRSQPIDQSQEREKWQLPLLSPISGKVLRVFQESAAVVNPGTNIIEVGNPKDLEVEIDVLSSDAVKIKFGDSVLLEQWGGAEPLEGRVRVVEPAAFTKISALGVEEQRVYVIVDFKDPLTKRATLGDGYRVEAKIIIWEQKSVLQVPTSALFRHGNKWAVFAVKAGKVHLQEVEIDHRNGLAAEVLSGLAEGDTVIVHPGDKIADGVQVTDRASGK